MEVQKVGAAAMTREGGTSGALGFAMTFFVAVVSLAAIILLAAALWPCVSEWYTKRKVRARDRRIKRHGASFPPAEMMMPGTAQFVR